MLGIAKYRVQNLTEICQENCAPFFIALKLLVAWMVIVAGLTSRSLAETGVQQDSGFDFSTTTDCIASLETDDDVAQCIGQSATECLNNEATGVSSNLKQLCVFYELEEWEKRQEAVYPALLEHLRDQDDQVLVWGWGRMRKAEALQDFDDAWYSISEAQCRFEEALWERLGNGDDYLWCRMKLTAEYVLLLESAMRDECGQELCQGEKNTK